MPACGKCNSSFSNLEAAAQNVVRRLLAGSSVTAHDIHTLLEWLDKVRVGLWLGFRALDNNLYGIVPRFAVGGRMGLHDRMVGIYRTASPDTGLNFGATDTPGFAFTPSCFVLRVNSVLLFNISFQFLFSKRLGLPYPHTASLLPGKHTKFEMVPGTERQSRALLRPSLPSGAVEFYQPSFRVVANNHELGALYSSPYALQFLWPGTADRGKVLRRYGCVVRPVWEEVLDDPPPATDDLPSLLRVLTVAAMKWQLTLGESQLSLRLITPSHRAVVRGTIAAVRRTQRALIRLAGGAA